MGFQGLGEVSGGYNLGGPVGVVGGLGEVSGGYNLQNLAWTFADELHGFPSSCQVCSLRHLCFSGGFPQYRQGGAL